MKYIKTGCKVAKNKKHNNKECIKNTVIRKILFIASV